MYCKAVSEVGPAPGWSQKCMRMAGGELRKLAYWLFSVIALKHLCVSKMHESESKKSLGETHVYR